MRRAPALPLLLALVAAPACAPDPPPPSVLLVVADTLRADALACYGGRAAAPHVCGLAERGARFDAAYANAPWTPPSSVALLTGTRPGVYADAPADETSRYFHVGEEHELLAERLRARGYAAWAYVENELAGRSQTLQGFDLAPGRAEGALPETLLLGDDPRRRRMAGPAERILRSGTEPFFGLVWTLDPHAPYEPEAAQWPSLEAAGQGLPREPSFYAGLGHQNAPHRMREYAPSLSAEELAFVRRLYEAEVTSVDARVGTLLAAVERGGLRDRTFVVFTSDHGEAFGEGGAFLHGKSMHDALLRVPLLVAGPGVAPGLRVDTPVALVDVVPTLCELLEVECPPGVQGRGFASLLRGGADAGPARVVYASHPNDPSRGSEALVVGASKLVRHAGGRLELYDRRDDAAEQHDRSAERREEAEALAARLAELRAEDEKRRRAERETRPEEELRRTAEETERGLRALGYVESREEGAPATHPRPSPK